MKELFILFAIFTGDPEVHSEIVGVYTDPMSCQRQLIRNIKSAPPKYWFSCKHISLNEA